MKNIVVGSYAGFCGGVKLCIQNLEKALKENSTLYCIGQVVHNNDVVNYFKNLGLIVVDDLKDVPDNNVCVIRAHGCPKDLYESAKKRNIKLIDLTCPKVLKIRDLIKADTDRKDTMILLFGEKAHPEIQSTVSFCGKNVEIIENKEDLDKAIKLCENFQNITVISQTTFNEYLFLDYTASLKEKFPNVKIINTICNATSQRQQQTILMAQEHDCMIIIGGKNSSNSQKLYDISKKYCKKTIFIENDNELNLNDIKDENDIGIMAGASTPSWIIDKVCEKINL